MDSVNDENKEKTLIFSSFEEQETDNYRYWNSLSPEERLNEHFKLICRIYNYDPEKNDGYANEEIIFDEPADRKT